jgi:tRNA dimethylallyltransferase
LVGGSGLYVDSVLYGYEFNEPADPDTRKRLNGLSIEELTMELNTQGIPLPENRLNKRYLIRALETGGTRNVDKKLREHTLVLGLQPVRDDLDLRIAQRVERMFEAGLENEVSILSSRYSFELESMKGIGYREFKDYLSGHASLDETKQRIIHSTRQLAKKQRTWFKRNSSIHWVANHAQARELVDKYLYKKP